MLPGFTRFRDLLQELRYSVIIAYCTTLIFAFSLAVARVDHLAVTNIGDYQPRLLVAILWNLNWQTFSLAI